MIVEYCKILNLLLFNFICNYELLLPFPNSHAIKYAYDNTTSDCPSTVGDLEEIPKQKVQLLEATPKFYELVKAKQLRIHSNSSLKEGSSHVMVSNQKKIICPYNQTIFTTATYVNLL